MSDPRAQLQQIRERADAATEGPWTLGLGYGAVIAPPEQARPGDHAFNEDDYEAYGGMLVGESIRRHNATFIGHARTDVPRLVDALSAVLELKRPDEPIDDFGKGYLEALDDAQQAITAAMGGGES